MCIMYFFNVIVLFNLTMKLVVAYKTYNLQHTRKKT